MDQISASQFKATCLAVMEDVRTSGKPVLVTKRGVPLVEVVPARAATNERRELGRMRGSARLADDLIEPAVPVDAWEAGSE